MTQKTRIMPFWVFAILAMLIALPAFNVEAHAAKKKRAAAVSKKRKAGKLIAKRSRKKQRRGAGEASSGLAYGKPRVSQSKLIEAKHQALELVTNSGELSKLAGLQTRFDTSDETGSPQHDNHAEYYDGEDPNEVEAGDDVAVDLDQFKNMWLSFVDGSDGGSYTSTGIEKQKIMAEIMDWLGTQYVFGGTGRSGIDCSAFMMTIFGAAANVQLPRTAAMQFETGKPVLREKLEFGDLVFFHTRRNVYASHVGVYLGDNLFAHASSRYGVTVSSLESTFYNEHYIGARRVSANDNYRGVTADGGKISSFQN